MERTLTLDDLREFEQYPGLAVDRKAHFSRFANKTIVHRDYHRNYTLMTYILLFFTRISPRTRRYPSAARSVCSEAAG